MQISALDFSSYVGVIGIGRIKRGSISPNTTITVIGIDSEKRNGRILDIFEFHGLDRIKSRRASAGDIVAVTGIDGLRISDTVCNPEHVEPLPPLSVDQPTLSMTFQVNDSPFAGRDGRFVTSRNLRDRLHRELLHNVEGEILEPFELLTVDVEDVYQGKIMERLGERRAEVTNIIPDGQGRVRLDYIAPSRGLIGFRSEFLSISSGTGLMYHAFDHYGPKVRGALGDRNNGVLVSMATGHALAYALFNLQERGRLFVAPGTAVYEGMVIGIHSRNNDLAVNPLKAKQLTNIRASGNDENILLTNPIETTLEYALDFINDDELVEVTPDAIRIRKKLLREQERRRAA